ncbi:FecR domain-containing protein [Parapedobacter koreensis]|uniref:FecR family protein n=1 Tax=Parapedobacter koreensis TaxID=332977 RepID=A0A1H7RAZ1_9SPHI|nr:FecR family protein [Parapedobacter koreensis]SEL57332.1 FecR family protein [Parapedobacter koreensis]
MIQNAEYVKELIRKDMEGTLTQSEHALLMVAEKLHDEDEWFRMTVDVLCELDDLPGVRLKEWRPDFASIRAKADRWRRRKSAMVLLGKTAGTVGILALLGCIVYYTIAEHHGARLGDCTSITASGDLPASEFACVVQWGDTASLTVDRSSRGRLGRIRNIEVWRQPDGVLALIPTREAMASDTVGYPAIRIVTAAHQQCVVQLPDGSHIRLNAGSSLDYPLWNMDKEVTYARLMGQAWVQLREKEKSQRPVRLVIETANSQLQSSEGEYMVSATRRDTKTVLLNGRLVAFAREGSGPKEGRELIIPGEYVHHENCCTPADGTIMTRTHEGCTDIGQALVWTKATRHYRNAPLREFVADMSRWYGIKVENLNCVPDGPRVTASVCYQAPVEEIYGYIHQAGVFMYEGDGMISFCGPKLNPMERPDERGLLAYGQTHD